MNCARGACGNDDGTESLRCGARGDLQEENRRALEFNLLTRRNQIGQISISDVAARIPNQNAIATNIHTTERNVHGALWKVVEIRDIVRWIII